MKIIRQHLQLFGSKGTISTFTRNSENNKFFFINKQIFYSQIYVLCSSHYLFLFRSIHFLACFMYEFGQGDKSVEDALNKAYRQSLKHSHDWIRRGIFSVNI